MKNDLNLGLIFCFIFEQLLDHLISGNFEIIITPKFPFIPYLGFSLFPRPPTGSSGAPTGPHSDADRRGLLGEEQRQAGDGLIKLDFIFEIFAPATAATR